MIPKKAKPLLTLSFLMVENKKNAGQNKRKTHHQYDAQAQPDGLIHSVIMRVKKRAQ